MTVRRSSRSPATADRLLAVVTVVIHVLAPTPGPTRPAPTGWESAFGLALALGMGVPLLWRRTRPLFVLAAVAVAYTLFVLVVHDVPPFAVWIALYSSARYAPSRQALIAAAATVGVLAAVLVGIGQPLDSVLSYLLVTVVVGLSGLLISARQAQLATRRREAVAAERLRIARDLHDLVGHGVSGIAIQSSTARLALAAGRHQETNRALEQIEVTSRDVLRQMRQLVGVLRSEDAATSPQPTLDDVAELVEQAGSHSVRADLQVSGDPSTVPASVGLAAYRIVQEALTNVAKHAAPAHAHVRIDISDRAVCIDVTDDGVGNSAVSDGAGNGILGMRERAAACGGELTADPRDDGPGWRVKAKLPLAPEAR